VSPPNPTYAELEVRLAQADQIVEALRAEIAERESLQEQQQIMIRVLRLVGSEPDAQQLIQQAALLLRDWTGCDAVGVRLRDGEDFPFIASHGFAPAFVEQENSVGALDESGTVVRDSTGNPGLECLCGDVLCGRTDPTKDGFTTHGSFWTNHATAWLGRHVQADRQARWRRGCQGQGYDSVAVLPLRVAGNVLGLVLLCDKRRGRFSPGKIAHLERLADSLAVAVSERRATESLRQGEVRLARVVENMPALMCAVDQQSRVLVWNRGCETATGYPAADIVGNPKAFQRLFPDATYRQSVLDAWSRGGNEFHDWELDVTCKDGGIKTIAWSSVSARFPIQPWFVWAIGVDVTERNQDHQQVDLQRRRLRDLASQLQVAEERERRRIAQDLHDHVSQGLVAIKLHLLGALRDVPLSPGQAQQRDTAVELLGQVASDINTLTFELCPPTLYDIGLEAALEWLTKRFEQRSGIACQFSRGTAPTTLDQDVRVLLFRCAGELLRNAERHAQATQVQVAVRGDDHAVTLSVHDDGVGFDVTRVMSEAPGFGLFSIRERVASLKGRLDVDAGPGRGSRFTVTVPIRLSPAEAGIRES